jgi:hypothetical protein
MSGAHGFLGWNADRWPKAVGVRYEEVGAVGVDLLVALHRHPGCMVNDWIDHSSSGARDCLETIPRLVHCLLVVSLREESPARYYLTELGQRVAAAYA